MALADEHIVTLDNVHTVLPGWDPNSPNHLYALVDMGSNGIRFSISDLSPPRARLLHCVYRERAAISLYDALEENPVDASDSSDSGPTSAPSTSTLALNPAPANAPPLRYLAGKVIKLVAVALARFHRIAHTHYAVPLDHVAVLATEAVRRTINAEDLIKAIADAAPGWRLRVVQPQVEILLGAMGVRAELGGHPRRPMRGLVLDLGGGSVQMAWVQTDLAAAAVAQERYEMAAATTGRSLPFGAARVTRCLKAIEKDSTTRKDNMKRSEELEKSIAVEFSKTLRDLGERFPLMQSAVDYSLSPVATAPSSPTSSSSSSSSLSSSSPASPPASVPSALFYSTQHYHDNLDAARKSDDEKIDIYLCGGGFRGYGSMLMHLDRLKPYPIPVIGGYKVSAKRFFNPSGRLIHLAGKAAIGESKILGVSKRRRKHLFAIISIVRGLGQALDVKGVRSVTFCHGGNREGALFMMLPEAVREAHPLWTLALSPLFPSPTTRVGDGGGGNPAEEEEERTLRDVLATFRSAFLTDKLGAARSGPSAVPATIFNVGLAPLFATRVWEGTGHDAEYNVARVLNDSNSRDLGVPGMSHLARALLALALCQRWGARPGRLADRILQHNLRELVARSEGDEAVYWAEYLGAVAKVLAKIVPAWPSWAHRQAKWESLSNMISFKARYDGTSKDRRRQVLLVISISESAMRTFHPQEFGTYFKGLNKARKFIQAEDNHNLDDKDHDDGDDDNKNGPGDDNDKTAEKLAKKPEVKKPKERHEVHRYAACPCPFKLHVSVEIKSN